MSEKIVNYEQFEYSAEVPFQILNIYHSENNEDVEGKLQHHWHSELEITYIQEGNKTKHIVDGHQIADTCGKAVVVNSDSIHNILADYTDVGIGDVAATVLIISRSFLKETIPGYEEMYFIPDSDKGNEEIGKIMEKLSQYGTDIDGNPRMKDYDYLFVKGLVYELLHCLMKYRLSWRKDELPINRAKNIERIKGAISYIENHFNEQLSQEVIANKFYFSSGYFSRCFHNALNMTFVEFVSKYRVHQARILLISTDMSVLDIALECGFSDSRRFIMSFKKEYGITPLQYRKANRVA
ncbi:MAG: helix-turn-helix domain-containing protein [Butyrivibrio sp.]|nr:helix-turn-helix domain-containing protein [Butyrivibrio sp.]